MTKSSAEKPRRRRKRIPQRPAGTSIETPQPPAELPVEPIAIFIEAEEPAELIRKPGDQLVERQALEPERESGEQVAPGEIE